MPERLRFNINLFPLDTADFGLRVVAVGLDEFLRQALYSLLPELVGWNGLAATLCLGKLSHA